MIKHKTIPIAAILIFAGGILFYTKNNHKPPPVNYNLFQTGSGWGYNILVNDSIYIHQEIIPVINTNKGFDSKLQAKAAAELVVHKLAASGNPMLNKSDIETIILDKGPSQNE